jgi:hypothetical protein
MSVCGGCFGSHQKSILSHKISLLNNVTKLLRSDGSFVVSLVWVYSFVLETRMEFVSRAGFFAEE